MGEGFTAGAPAVQPSETRGSSPVVGWDRHREPGHLDERGQVEVLPGNFEVAGRIAKLWVNGIAEPLTDTRTCRAALPSGVALSGDDVFVSGTINQEDFDSPGVAAVWANGTLQPLTDGSQPATADDVAISGAGVYVGGSVWDGTYNTAAVWKNGVRVELETHDPSSGVVALATEREDVYAVGFDGQAATLWVNGKPERLSHGTYPAVAQAIALQR